MIEIERIRGSITKKIANDQSGIVHHIAVIGAVIVLIGAIGTYIGIMSRSHAATPAVSGSPLCNTANGANPRVCISDDGHTSSGSLLKAQTSNPGASQNVYLSQATDICKDGTVHDNQGKNGKISCPFNVGTGLNGTYDRDNIYRLKFNSNGKCIATQANSGGYYAIVAGCTENGSLWVGEPLDGGTLLVNVYISNKAGSGSVLVGPAAGLHLPIQGMASQEGSAIWKH